MQDRFSKYFRAQFFFVRLMRVIGRLALSIRSMITFRKYLPATVMSSRIIGRSYHTAVTTGGLPSMPRSLIGCRTNVFNPKYNIIGFQTRSVSTKQRRRWKVRKYHFKLRLKRTMRKMRVPYVSSKSRGQVKKKPILYDFRPYLRRKLKRAER